MKKIYKTVSCEITHSGLSLCLDGKSARTPAGNAFQIPTSALAEAVAEEWRAQGENVRKETMPLSHIASVAIDLAAKKRGEVIADILPYGDTDLVCYRAGDIPALKNQQSESLDPMVAWASKRFGVVLRVTDGVMPLAQPEDNKEKLAASLSSYDEWKLAVLACAVGPLGSLVLALALIEGYIDAETAFRLSQLEESYETEKWGEDEEKQIRTRNLRDTIVAVGRFLHLLV
jgi:chaperone required for assembly of F1-ATPase